MKTIFITGASTGLGKSTAKLFHANGWKVIATMRRPEQETELNQLENVTLLPLDIIDLEQIWQTVQYAISLGYIDVVFNNAGYGLIGPVESNTEKQIRAQFETNFFGLVNMIQAVLPGMRSKKHGHIINFSPSSILLK